MAWKIRHNARVEARKLMIDPQEVKDLQARDIELYQNPDGPTFEWVIEDTKKDGLKGNDIYEAIIEGSQRTNKKVNKSLGFEKQE